MGSLFERADFGGSQAWVISHSGARAAGTITYADPTLVLRTTSMDGWFGDGDLVVMGIGLSDALYTFQTRLCHRSGGTLRFEVPDPSAIVRKQVRAFVRVPVEIPVRLTLASRLGAVGARLLDLSGGGARVLAPVSLALGDLVELELELQGERMVLSGKVVRPSDRQSQAGIAFVDLTKAQLNRIVSFTFYRQAELLRQRSG